MNSFCADPAVRQRLIEFLGGNCLEQATASYLTHSDGWAFDRRDLRPPVELDWFLERDLDIARSLADSASLLLHLDVEYVNFDSPGEAHLDPWRAFDLQEPVVAVIESLLLGWGIRPLHIITGQGHHFIWRIRRGTEIARRMVALSPAPEVVAVCRNHTPPLLQGQLGVELQSAFATLSLVMEFVAHCVKQQAVPLTKLPVEITAVHVGAAPNRQREIVSIDISEYGDPLHTRMVRMPFTNYLKPWVTGLARSLGVENELPSIRAIPLHEFDVRQAIMIRQEDSAVRDLARRACVRIPQQEEGTLRLLDDYLGSRLRRFHEYFYAARHDEKQRWPQTYDRTPLDSAPSCVRYILQHPNDLLLKPAGMQLVTRFLLSAGWHPRHIGGLIRSKFENPSFGWGIDWNEYEPSTRADFYTRVFAGQFSTGLDQLVDFNCTSTREKGFCFPPTSGSCGLEDARSTLLSQACK